MTLVQGPTLLLDGLLVHVDAANPRSYPGSGASWFDLSGNNKTASLVSSPTYSSEGFGSFVFSGTQLATIGAITSNLTTTMTYSIWIKPTSIGTARTIFWDDDGQGGGDSWVDITAAGKIETQRDSDGFGLLTCNTTLSSGFWYNVVLVANGASGKSVYLNGLVDGSNAIPIASRSGKSYISLAAKTPFPPSPSGSQFIGSISAFSIYSRALSAAEVLLNYNAYRGRYGI